MAQQLGLDLPSRTALGRDAFLVAPSNAVAMAMIDRWPAWSDGKLLLTGPAGAGKTHLSHVWAARSAARIIAASSLNTQDVPTLAQGHLVVEDVHQIGGQKTAETALFHLHNLMLEEGRSLLLTGTLPVAQWGLTLPDLLSRLQGVNAAALEPPDDALLSAVLIKLLADRQINPNPTLIPYLLTRIERSFAAAIDIVARLDAASIALKRPVSRTLAGEVLDK